MWIINLPFLILISIHVTKMNKRKALKKKKRTNKKIFGLLLRSKKSLSVFYINSVIRKHRTQIAMGANNSKSLQISHENLETFSIFWLDAQVNKTEDNRNTQLKLREIINHLKTFDDLDECYQRILSLSTQDRLVLIVSGRCGRQLVPQIHHLRQVSSIYVYCMDKKANELWAKDFIKIKSVIVQLKDLIHVVKQDQQTRVKIEEPLAINIFNVANKADQSTTGLNGNFIHSLLLIDVLIRMKSIESDKQQLIQLCQKEYQTNQKELIFVREFEKDYRSEKALWWYTRDSFLYRMLNKALRVQNIDLLFLFRFVISDIYHQLKQYQQESPIRVYRGQVMSIDELNTLQQSIDNLISINSFFSTSTNRHQALRFLNRSKIPGDLCRILFVIDADPRLVKSKPFADISSLSYFNDECEVLFMIGSIFRLIKIEEIKNEKILTIHMELCGDDEHDLKELFDHMKNELGGGNEEVNLRSFGQVLHEMGKYDSAEKIYHQLLAELPSNDPSLGDLYWNLGRVTCDKAAYDSSLEWFQKSLVIHEKKGASNYVNIGNLYNWIGENYRMKRQLETALENYNKAIELFRNANDEDHPDMANFYNNIAIVYYDQKKYTEALDFYKKSLAIRKQHLPSNHPDIAGSHNNIGNVYSQLNKYDLGMEHYQQSIQIYLKSLPADHPQIALSYENIALIHEQKGEWKQALELFKKALNIYQHSFSSQHPDVLTAKAGIERVSANLK